MEKLHLATMNDKPWWASISLDDVFELGVGVFEASWGMGGDGFMEDFIQGRSLGLGVASLIDFEGEIKELGDIFASLATGEDDWGEW